MTDLWPSAPPAPPRFPDAPPSGEEPLVPPAPDAWPELQVDPPRTVTPSRAAVLGGLAGAIAMLLVTAIAGLTFGWVDDDGDRSDGAVTTGPLPRTADGAPDIQAILAKVERSVVAIETSVQTSQGVFQGAGSGIVLSTDGLVLTNAHVVAQQTDITVVLWNGSHVDATLVGSVPDDDLAVLQIQDPVGLEPAELGSSDDMLVGDPVVAIGNALNLGGPPSVTLGIVSAKDRAINAPGISLEGLIQTDAAINPGNSGGPLVNADGQVVGINTAIVEDSQNIGFAIAIDLARPIIERIKEGDGTVTPDSAFLGLNAIDLDAVPEAARTTFGITATTGAMISDVLPGEAAEAAGLEIGDVIVEIDGAEITGGSDVGAAVRSHEPGDDISVVVERRGKRVEVSATLGRRG